MKAEYKTTKDFLGVSDFEYPWSTKVNVAKDTVLELTDFTEYCMTFKTEDGKLFSLHRHDPKVGPCDYAKYSTLPEGIMPL